ncbi:MAG: class I SAM-dependent methyltransferase [Patescibacteria group bacterium]
MTEIFQKTYWERDNLDQRRQPNHPVVAAFATKKIDEIKKSLNSEAIKTILDVGAGNGFFSYYLQTLGNLTAVDYSEKMIALNPVKNKMVMNATQLNFENNSFDLVFEAGMLHHVQNLDQVISEMKRVTKKYLVILEPNRNNPLMFLFGLINKEEKKSLKFSLNYLKNKLEQNDLKIIKAFSHGAILPNKVPTWALPVLKIFDKKIPVLGFNNIIICEKKN